MRRAIVSILLLFCGSPANAQSCPDFFRFVDFGLKSRDGMMHRGGPMFRAENLGGDPLLIPGRTQCLNVRDLNTDGRGNPIPVVSSITYDPRKADIDLTELRVATAEDTAAMAEQNASRHLAELEKADTVALRGENFLCIRSKAFLGVSCQLASPYAGNSPLVVYCDAVNCTMSVLAIDDQLFISAAWPITEAYLSDPISAGFDAFDKVQKIQAFLRHLSSSLKRDTL